MQVEPLETNTLWEPVADPEGVHDQEGRLNTLPARRF